MLELISIIASTTLCILTPIEVAKIRGGWVREKFANNRSAFIAAYHRQLTALTWLGLVFGSLLLATSWMETEPGETVVRLITALMWFAVGAVCVISRRRLPPAAPPDVLSGNHA